MSEMPRCDDTSSENTQRSSLPAATDKPRKSGKSSTRKQSESGATDKLTGAFQLYDLRQLTFQPIGSEQVVDCWHASAQVFQTYIQQFADVQNVNTEIWPLGERLYFINKLWEWCQAHGEPFPFEEGKMLMPKAENS